jgi:predicted dehydrogenase
MKSSAAAAVGTAVASHLGALPAVHAAGSDTLRVGLIGCGGRGTGAAQDCARSSENVRIVALADAFKDRVDGCRERLKQEISDKVEVTDDHCFTGLDAYKGVLDSGVDYVILASPPGFRPQHLEAAVAAGKHIFTEKPVSVDGPGTRMVLAAYEQALNKGLGIAAGTQRRHQTGYRETIGRIHDGDIGDILAARCYWNGSGIWFRPRQEGMSDVAYQIHNWYHFLWLCGDHIVEQHVHNLDVCNWAMKAHPVKCSGMGGRTRGNSSRPDGDPNEVGHIFDHFAVEYEYPNGVHIFSQCRQIAGCWNSVSESLVGTKGTCQVDRYAITGENAWRFRGKDNKPYEQEHADLVESIRAGKPINELKNVAESSLTAIMGRMATYTGKEVTWEQALNSKLDTFPADLKWDMKLPVSATPVPGQSDVV